MRNPGHIYNLNDPAMQMPLLVDRISGEEFDGTYRRLIQAGDHTLRFYLGDLPEAETEHRAMAAYAVNTWAKLMGYQAVETQDAHDADILFILDNEVDGGFVSPDVDTATHYRSIVTISAEEPTLGTEFLYLHEVGHAIGLDHPADYLGNTSDPDDDEIYGGDSPLISVMTYSGITYKTTITPVPGSARVTPGVADILAVQKKYDHDPQQPVPVNAGNTFYGFDPAVHQAVENGAPVDYEDLIWYWFTRPVDLPDVSWTWTSITVYDTGGIDTLDLSNEDLGNPGVIAVVLPDGGWGTESVREVTAQVVNLNPGYTSNVYGSHANLVIANGTIIENYIAGAGDDIITGNTADNRIEGRNGNDTLQGGPGGDVLMGGPGADTARYAGSNAGVVVRLHTSYAGGGDAEGDTLTGIEHLVGSPYNDILAGDGEDNILKGEDGDDVLYGGPAGGDDMMYGGNGDDRIFGGRGDDTLTGGAGNDVLKGGRGADTIIVDGDDMDVVFGGPDSDTFRFFESDLGGGTIRDFTDGEDIIDLTEFTGISSTDDLDIISHGDNVRIRLSGTDYSTTIILSGFDISNLDNSDFIF